MRPNAGVKIDADMTEAFFALGFMDGVARAMENKKTLNDMLDTEAEWAVVEQARMIDELASKQKTLNHMYEVGHWGMPEARLFRLPLAGQRGNRYVIPEFLEAKVPNPTFYDQGFRNVGPRGGEKKDQTSLKREYIFRQRAFIMESGRTLTIRPKNGKVLRFVAGDELIFRPSVTVNFHKTAGKFTAALRATNSRAVMVADTRMRARLEANDKELQAAIGRTTSRTSRAAFDAGEKKGFTMRAEFATKLLEEARRENRIL